ncbi:heme ABC transporter ATP-binding protein [Rhizobium tumorigenes]|uniref:heme ABC transporter ATP-binding protein n=1 Tax=Rhizobium tumorigenes TaxID=2041385 RepID=UPI00241D307F|nr:heme ABC transporter ATP-binding protein [Rhizobium tumorigenes]WFR99802.1 heme ABC transporter ATP-binding protein [Rhizobium tumorigenes]
MAIDVSNLSVRLAGKSVVDGVSFTAHPGQLTAICGPNGSGKTTVMKAISGELAYGGSIRLGESEVKTMKPWALALSRGVLPQASTLSFPFSVREIVLMGLTAGANSKPQHAERIAMEALRAVDLAGFEGRLYEQLSGGEQQRVQFARVLCQIPQPVVDDKPCWLLLDEPVSSLDISHQLAVMQLSRAFCAAGGGVIAIMHDLNLTALFADRIVLLKAGRLAATGAVSSVLTDENLHAVFGCELRVNRVPEKAIPFVLPHSVFAAAGV